ncbi:MAG: winged helix-turn-helix domain-containing protein [Candidatus Woesearchaeota archaeon]
MEFRITIVKSEKPQTTNINEELFWLGGSLGLFGTRDKDKSCFRVFIELLRQARAQNRVSSDEIAETLNLSRGTVIHHINKLMDAGIVIATHNRYYLKVSSLAKLIALMREDLNQQMKELEDIAKDIDDKLRLV